ncbi:hypothetical protein KCU85_g422, partial [Aureobasidium melanogenum]
MVELLHDLLPIGQLAYLLSDSSQTHHSYADRQYRITRIDAECDAVVSLCLIPLAHSFVALAQTIPRPESASLASNPFTERCKRSIKLLEKAFPTAHQVCGELNARSLKLCARNANCTGFFNCHKTVEYTSISSIRVGWSFNNLAKQVSAEEYSDAS